jgi:hypothetical protein
MQLELLPVKITYNKTMYYNVTIKRVRLAIVAVEKNRYHIMNWCL